MKVPRIQSVIATQQSVQWIGGDATRQCALARRCSLEAHSPICGFDKHFSGFRLFLLSGIFPARPTTTNANRWVVPFHSQKHRV